MSKGISLSRMQRLLWFLSHPKLYPELFRRLQRNITLLIAPASATHTQEARAKAKQEATRWCEQYAIDTKTALQKLAGLATFDAFDKKFETYLKAADDIIKTCPVQMGGAGNLDLAYQLAEFCQATRVIETGVSYGWSSLAFLLSLKGREGSLLISTDLPYIFKDSEKYVGCVVPAELRPYWKILPFSDREALPKALEALPTIDLCHYDSDKSYDGRMWAYPKLWGALRSGGFFISDDVDDDFGFRDFCNSIGQTPLIVKTPTESGAKYVGVLVKP